MECNSTWNVTQNGIPLMLNAAQNRMSLKIKCHSKLNATQTGMPPKMDCISKSNFT